MKGKIKLKGGPGSGHHGHAGRPGKVGGSTGGSGGSSSGGSDEDYKREMDASIRQESIDRTNALKPKYHEGRIYKNNRLRAIESGPPNFDEIHAKLDNKEYRSHDYSRVFMDGDTLTFRYTMKHPNTAHDPIERAVRALNSVVSNQGWMHYVKNATNWQTGDYHNDWVDVDIKLGKVFTEKVNSAFYMGSREYNAATRMATMPDWFGDGFWTKPFRQGGGDNF